MSRMRYRKPVNLMRSKCRSCQTARCDGVKIGETNVVLSKKKARVKKQKGVITVNRGVQKCGRKIPGTMAFVRCVNDLFFGDLLDELSAQR